MTQGIAGNYANVNDLDLYYERSGEQATVPLILLHGGFGATSEFVRLVPAPSAGREVVAVDLQGHGRTADIDWPLRYDQMADDVAALIRHLGLSRAGVMGSSLGGGVAVQTAVRHPELVRRLVAVSVAFRREGWHAESRAGMDQLGAHVAVQMLQTPMYELYARTAPRLGDSRLGGAVGQDGRSAEAGLRLVEGGGGAEDAHPDRDRGRRQHRASARRRILRAAGRWSARRWLCQSP